MPATIANAPTQHLDPNQSEVSNATEPSTLHPNLFVACDDIVSGSLTVRNTNTVHAPARNDVIDSIKNVRGFMQRPNLKQCITQVAASKRRFARDGEAAGLGRHGAKRLGQCRLAP